MQTLPIPKKGDRVQVMKKNELPFLYTKTSWSPAGDLQFSAFREKGQQLKCVLKKINHTPGILRAIPLEFMKSLAKITSQKPSLHSKGLYKVYPGHKKSVREAGLAPPNFPTMGYLWKMQDEKLDIENEK